MVALTVAAPSTAASQIEVEVDPFAYALNGYSLHLAAVAGTARVSIGAFGIDVPRALHRNDDWSASMRGVGAKLDLLAAPPDGWFAGADVGLMRMSYTLDPSAATRKRNEVNLGGRVGYRLPVGGRGFYLAPWLGFSYSLGADDVIIDDQRFDNRPITLFPTVHLGWRF